MKSRNSQEDSAKRRIIALRLREERSRIEPKQGDFAARIGVSQVKQSALENGSNELRGEYLADAAALGVDVHYVLTGTRTSDLLDQVQTDLLSKVSDLSQHQVKALTLFLDSLRSSYQAD